MESYIQKLRNSLVHFSCFDMLELKYYRVSQQAKRGCELSFDLSDLWGCQRLSEAKIEKLQIGNIFEPKLVWTPCSKAEIQWTISCNNPESNGNYWMTIASRGKRPMKVTVNFNCYFSFNASALEFHSSVFPLNP